MLIEIPPVKVNKMFKSENPSIELLYLNVIDLKKPSTAQLIYQELFL